MSGSPKGRVVALAATVLVGGVMALGGTAQADRALPVCTKVLGQDFKVSANPALRGQAITFDGSCSKVPCPAFGSFPTCDPRSYAWRFGDGTTATGATATHSYAAAGTYDVTLTVEDYNTNTYSVTHQVTVLAVP